MGLLNFVRNLFAPRDDGPPYSLLQLRKAQKNFTDAELAGIASEVFSTPITLSRNDDDDNALIRHSATTAILNVRGFHFLIHDFARPYYDKPKKVAEQYNELHLRQAILDHRAWFAVDFIMPAEPPEMDWVHSAMARLFARACDDLTLTVAFFPWEKLVPYDSAMFDPLNEGNMEEAFARWVSPVTNISDDDPEMNAAIEEAKRTLPDFIEAFGNRQPDQLFTVKAPVSDGVHREFIWITVESINETTIKGTLGNRPVNLSGMHENDPVEIAREDVVDWVYDLDDEIKGNFTMPILLKAARNNR